MIEKNHASLDLNFRDLMVSCRKCRHEFCWICMQDWSLHGASTGGYFQCNRFSASAGTNEGGSSRNEGIRMKQKGQQVAWFLHHFTRFKAHSDSLGFEIRMHQETILRILCGLVQSLRKELVWLQGDVVPNPLEGLIEANSQAWPTINDIELHFQAYAVNNVILPFASAPSGKQQATTSGAIAAVHASGEKKQTPLFSIFLSSTATKEQQPKVSGTSAPVGSESRNSELDKLTSWIEGVAEHILYLNEGFEELIKCRHVSIFVSLVYLLCRDIVCYWFVGFLASTRHLCVLIFNFL